MSKAIALLRDRVLDPLWTSFNYTTFPPEQTNAAIEGLNQAMTPPFGMGGRLVWLINTNLCQSCPENVLEELNRTLPVIPENTVLLLTSLNKPDERLKSTKILKKFAQFQEFGLIPPWKTDLILKSVREAAQNIGVKLSTESAEFLAEAVGSNTRLLYNELEKLKLSVADSNKQLDQSVVVQLVRNTTQNSLQLASAISTGDTAKALTVASDLINANEPGLRIVATLVGQFRTWLWVKIMMERGERSPQAIAQAAEVRNHYRIKYLQQEVRLLSGRQLAECLSLLLKLEVSLKQGAAQMPTLQTKVIELCQVCQRR